MVVMASCSQEQGCYQAVGAAGWRYSDTIAYTPDLGPDSVPTRVHAVAVGLRHTNAYQFSNIYIELTTHQSDTVMVDTFNIRLADDYGHWQGTGIGVGFQRVDTLLRDIALEPGQPIYLRHIMRADTLSGIEQAGIIVL